MLHESLVTYFTVQFFFCFVVSVIIIIIIITWQEQSHPSLFPVWLYFLGHAEVHGNDMADRVAGQAKINGTLTMDKGGHC